MLHGGSVRFSLAGVALLVGGCSLYFEGSSRHGDGSGSNDDVPPADGSGGSDGSGGGGVPPSDSVPEAPAIAACDATVAPNDWIVFDSDRHQFNRDLFRIRADGTQLERLTTATAVDKDPAPSPDGSRIAFTSTRTGTPQIHVLELATGDVTQLTARPGGAHEPTFSNDGMRIAFRSGAAVYTMSSTGGTETFVADSGLDEFNALFSPHFSRDDGELYADRNNEIRAFSLTGGGSRYVVNNWTTTIKSPTPSPSGTAIAFETHVDSPPIGTSLWAVQVAIANTVGDGRRLTPAEAGADSRRPEWALSGLVTYERIALASGVSSIAIIPTEPGSVPCQVTTDLYDNRNPAWLTEP